MHYIDKAPIIVRTSEFRFGCKIQRCMISGILRIRIFDHRHHLHMRISHLFEIGCKAIYRFGILQKSFLHFRKRDLIDIERLTIAVCL